MSTAKGHASVEHHMPSLDGLRAVSILMVLLGHLSGTRNFGSIDLGIGNYAHLGVTVFFVISGFLITSLLISEQRQRAESPSNSFISGEHCESCQRRISISSCYLRFVHWA